MDLKEIINAIFDDLIEDAEKDQEHSGVFNYLEAKRQMWLQQIREVTGG